MYLRDVLWGIAGFVGGSLWFAGVLWMLGGYYLGGGSVNIRDPNKEAGMEAATLLAQNWLFLVIVLIAGAIIGCWVYRESKQGKL